MGRIGFRSNIYVSIRVWVRVISLNSPFIDYLEKKKIYSRLSFPDLGRLCPPYMGPVPGPIETAFFTKSIHLTSQVSATRSASSSVVGVKEP